MFELTWFAQVFNMDATIRGWTSGPFAKALADYQAEADTELSLQVEQRYEVLEQSDGGWWLAKNVVTGAEVWPCVFLSGSMGTLVCVCRC